MVEAEIKRKLHREKRQAREEEFYAKVQGAATIVRHPEQLSAVEELASPTLATAVPRSKRSFVQLPEPQSPKQFD